MSRCFPFPPPGYEGNARLDLNLIRKEKHREKKRKDKKDKHKKESSERKDKERSEGKKCKKADKDRKEKKHRDKKDKKKDKQRSSEEKKIVAGSTETQNSEKLVGPDSISKPISDGIRDCRNVVVELGKRVRNDNNQMVQKMLENGNGLFVEGYGVMEEKRENRRLHNGQSFRVDNNGGLGNGLVEIFSNQIRVEGGSCKLEKVENKKEEGKEKNENGNNERDGCEDGDQHNKKRKAEEDKKRKKEKKKKEKVKEKSSKEKSKQRASDGNLLDFHDNKESGESAPNHKEIVLNGFLHGNGFRPVISTHHQSTQNGSTPLPSQKAINLEVENGAVIPQQKINGEISLSSQSLIKDARNYGRASANNHVVTNGIISPHLIGTERKMKPCQTASNVAKLKHFINNNNSITDNNFFPSHLLAENGNKMASPSIEENGIHNKMDNNKELTMNGNLEAARKHGSASLSVKAKEKIDEKKSTKTPHPDLKYLSKILTVPELEWPQEDDQEWLFGCKDSQAKRPKLASSQIEWTKQVWAEAIQMESVDVTAMPYVIPY